MPQDALHRRQRADEMIGLGRIQPTDQRALGSTFSFPGLSTLLLLASLYATACSAIWKSATTG